MKIFTPPSNYSLDCEEFFIHGLQKLNNIESEITYIYSRYINLINNEKLKYECF